MGDANNDGAVNLFDAAAVLLESDFFNPVLQEGTPDCNMDGAVNLFDAAAVLLGEPPCQRAACAGEKSCMAGAEAAECLVNRGLW